MIGDLQLKLDIRSATDAVIALAGEFDIAHVARVERTLRVMLYSGRSLLIDASGLEFMDCAGLRVLLRARGEAQELGLSVGLVSPSPQVARVLDLTATREVLLAVRPRGG